MFTNQKRQPYKKTNPTESNNPTHPVLTTEPGAERLHTDELVSDRYPQSTKESLKSKRNESQIVFAEKPKDAFAINPRGKVRKPGDPVPDNEDLICMPCENSLLTKDKKKDKIPDYDDASLDFHVSSFVN